MHFSDDNFCFPANNLKFHRRDRAGWWENKNSKGNSAEVPAGASLFVRMVDEEDDHEIGFKLPSVFSSYENTY